MEYRIPSRGLIGFRSEFLTLTRGTGLLNHLFDGYGPWQGPIPERVNGALVSDRAGRRRRTPSSTCSRGGLLHRRRGRGLRGDDRGGEFRPVDMDVNVAKEKKLTNIRAAGADEALRLVPPRALSLEAASSSSTRTNWWRSLPQRSASGRRCWRRTPPPEEGRKRESFLNFFWDTGPSSG